MCALLLTSFGCTEIFEDKESESKKSTKESESITYDTENNTESDTESDLLPPEKQALAYAAEEIDLLNYDYEKESYKEFLNKLDAFAAKLSYEVYADSDKESNLCISPVSVYMALATECANGETRDEILNAVGVTYDEVKNFTKILYARSNRYAYRSRLENELPLMLEELTNSIWVDKSTNLKEDGINNLANDFNCDLFSVNFKTGEGERAINEYIKEKHTRFLEAA